MDTGWTWLVLLAVAALLWIGAVVLRQRRQKRELEARFSALMTKYHDQQIVVDIMQGKIWQGMTQEQLSDSRGAPEDTDQTVYKTKTKETWKYGRTGKNRFRERIYVENGTVVGWKE